MAKVAPQTGLGGGDVAFHHNEDVTKKVILVSPFVKGFAGDLLLLLLLFSLHSLQHYFQVSMKLCMIDYSFLQAYSSCYAKQHSLLSTGVMCSCIQSCSASGMPCCAAATVTL
jgi:hypothetical protein